ncbi:MAG TPA: hypothetical protein PLE73_11645, partial [Spirochaetota bacterium]|nr:hypothetical protein [Spirochaetota bacterium]
ERQDVNTASDSVTKIGVRALLAIPFIIILSIYNLLFLGEFRMPVYYIIVIQTDFFGALTLLELHPGNLHRL